MNSLSSLRMNEELSRLTHPFATPTLKSLGRRFDETPDPLRPLFERDAHRILHSNPFRRMRAKTQVFFSPENDHITTRMDHSLYVATISQTICRALKLNDDLAYAIALGHDLGHSPFGHPGEKVLAKLWAEAAHEEVDYTHEGQSLRVIDQLTQVSGRKFEGLNLTYEIRDGIRCHCGETTERLIAPRPKSDSRDPSEFTGRQTLPYTMEGCVVRMADRISYLGRDYDDAQLAKLSQKLPPLPKEVREVLGYDNRTIINSLVSDLIAQNQKEPETCGFNSAVHEAALLLRDYNYRYIYQDPRLEEYRSKTDFILIQIFHVLYEYLTQNGLEEIMQVKTGLPDAILHFAQFVQSTPGAVHPRADTGKVNLARLVIDYISLMSDHFAFKTFESLVLPHPIV